VSQPSAYVGIVARTGSAVAVAVTGSPRRPEFAGRWPIDLVPDDLPRQPYHAAADAEPSDAEEIVHRVERAATAAAEEALREVASTVRVATVALLVRPTAPAPATVAQVVRSHVAMHAAEGELYRDALMSAAELLGVPVQAVRPDALPEASMQVQALGVAAGRPWRREEKDAARCALAAMTGS
jgi:predicted Zn-ribbon and HTH transcriptional regulator